MQIHYVVFLQLYYIGESNLDKLNTRAINIELYDYLKTNLLKSIE